MIRYKIEFYGRVQGVGFRYKSMSIANRIGLTGIVKNEYDGSVYMEVQGELKGIEKLVDELMDDRFIRIDKFYKTELNVIKDEKGFIIGN